MNKSIASTLFLTLAGVGLAGCSHRGERVAVRPLSSNAMLASTNLEGLLTSGRDQLAAGHYGLAIAQFRNAVLLDPQSAAAQNGLAVAYAQIGRTDLARRYFERAIAYAPDEAAYRRNYARLGAVQPFARPVMSASVDVSGNGPAPVQGAMVALRTTGNGKPRLEALGHRSSGPHLATADTPEGGRKLVRLVTRTPDSAPPTVPAPVMMAATTAPESRAADARPNSAPVWRIVTSRPATSPAVTPADQPRMERVSARRLHLRTGSDTADISSGCAATNGQASVATPAGTLTARIISCRS